MLPVEVNLRDMGLSRMSLRMCLPRRGGAPPLHRVRMEALRCQLLLPMYMGCVVRILSTASSDEMRLGWMASGEKGTLIVAPASPWSEMIKWDFLE